jgi:hypothetical protein
MADTLQTVRRVLYAARWTIIAFVIVTTWLVQFRSASVQSVPILIAVLATAVLTFVSTFAARKWERLRRPILSLIADMALVTVVVYFSDGIQSPFYPLYYVVVIIAAVDFGMRGSLLCASALAIVSVYVDTIAPGPNVGGAIIARDVIRTVPYLFLTALITGALRSRVRVLDDSASEMRAQRAASDREMEVAARIQRAQLPLETPSLPGVQIATTYKPAREVGGDLYDFYPTRDDLLGVTVADVAGKGVPAALLVSSCKYALRESCCDDLVRMMSAANRQILSVTTDETFVTALYGTISLESREFAYVNAGHMPPMVVRASGGEVVCAEYSDPPLGIAPDSQYVEQRIALQPGDTLVLYTDGVTDALESSGAGIEVLRSFLMRMEDRPVSQWGDCLLEAIQQPQHLDDVTMVVIQVE